MNLAVQFNVFKILCFGKKGCRSRKWHLIDGDFPSKQQLVSTPYLFLVGLVAKCAICLLHTRTTSASKFPLGTDRATEEVETVDGKWSCCLEGKSPSIRCHFLLLHPFFPKHKILNTLNWTAKFTNVYLYNLEMPKKWFPYTPFSKMDGSFKD